MTLKAFQDYYEDHSSQCYGCGRLNQHGLKIKSHWDGDESVCRFNPHPYHTAMAGYVYGGLIASVIDCHSTGTAAAYAYRQAGREQGTKPELRYVTASLHVDYIQPTPIDATMELRANIKEFKARKVIIQVTLTSSNRICAKGEVVAVLMPDDLKPNSAER